MLHAVPAPRLRLFSLCIALLLCVAYAHAQVTLVTDRSNLNANDCVDWGVLGPVYTSLSNPTALTSNGGVAIQAEVVEPGLMLRLDQSAGWDGCFTPGDRLLYTGYEQGPLVITFGQPVISVGSQIQWNGLGAYTARITAYDGADNPLGYVTRDGLSNFDGDGTALFIGVADSNGLPSIQRIVFSLENVPNRSKDFTINQLDFRTRNTEVPEPGSLALLAGVGVASSLFLLRRRR